MTGGTAGAGWRHKHLGPGRRAPAVFPASPKVFQSWRDRGGFTESYEEYLRGFGCTCERGRREYMRRGRRAWGDGFTARGGDR